VKVLVVTEIRLYRDGVADALRQLPYIHQTATAATGAEAVRAAHDDCDVVLMDMALTASAQAVEAVLAVRPGVKVVALGVPDGGPEVVAFAEAGIAGYVSREATLVELGEALRAVLRGEAACSGKVAAELLRHIALQARARRSDAWPRQLTPREREVLKLLKTGMSNKQIARAMDLQLSTVKNHVHSLLAKFGVRCRDEVVQVVAGEHLSVAVSSTVTGPQAQALPHS
jgi:DNA-binding NarL/FixJ family response regulator